MIRPLCIIELQIPHHHPSKETNSNWMLRQSGPLDMDLLRELDTMFPHLFPMVAHQHISGKVLQSSTCVWFNLPTIRNKGLRLIVNFYFIVGLEL